MDTASKVAEFLLSIKAFKFSLEQPYQWASGWKSPVYCDNRLTLSYPKMRGFIADELARAVNETFPKVEAVAGVATAGIPYGTLVADRLKLPFLYVRAEAKKHGLGNQIEGGLYAGERVVVLEDLVSTGGSSLKAVEALRAADAEVIGLASVFNYGFPQAKAAFDAAGVPHLHLCGLGVLAERAIALGYLTPQSQVKIEAWRAHPESWG
jgi:orotate phosphoribosyltransferase